MFRKSLSALLIVMILISLFSVPAGAVTSDRTCDTSNLRSISMEVENNTATYYNENGEEFNGSAQYATRKCRTALPESYDLRDYGRSTGVKDQGNLGFCWSFASTASMESSILTKKINEATSDTLDLSETGNSWYLRTNTTDTSSPIYNDYLYDPYMGALGGIAEYVADSLSSGFGAYPEELISYDDFNSGYPEAYRYYSDYRLKEYTQLPNDVDLIKQKIMDNGAVYYSYNSFTENYYTSNGVQTYYDNGLSLDGLEPYTGHAVTIIGWDDNFSKDNFNPASGVESDGAWLCKNSWGEDYQTDVKEGYEGYFWASYENNVNSLGQFEMQDGEAFDNVYQHQATGNAYLYSEAGFFSAANVYTAKSDEKLEQICFSNIDATDITAKIYKLNENYTSPVEGELLCEFSTDIALSGTHCIDVPKDIVFNKGDIFSVVIEGSNLIAKFKESQDFELDTAGKSYISVNENEWLDSADDASVSYAAIKAYTSNLSVDKSELNSLIEQAKEIKPDKNVDDALIDELNTAISQAEKVLSNKNATSNNVNNTYCELKGKYETIENYTFNINGIEDFTAFLNSNTNSKYIELNTDLDFAGTNILENYEPINFNGRTFDGNGHIIRNLTMTANMDNSKAGIFDVVKNSVIKDITFENADVEGFFTAGVIASEAINSQFINCNIKNSTVKAKDGMYVALISGSSNNCTYTDCSAENNTVVGGYVATLFTLDDYTNCTFDNCTASDYTLISSSYVCDNMGFDCYYNSNNYDAFVAITVTDDTCTIEQIVGEIASVYNNGVEITPVDGVYNIEKINGSANPDITFNDYEFVGFAYSVDFQTKEIIIDGYCKDNSEVVIPDVMYGLPVTALDQTFNCYGVDEDNITSISIPDSIKSIPDGCFANLSNLKHATINKGVEEIGEFAIGYYITDSGYSPIDGFTIYGYAGTAAEEYADANGFAFVDLSD